MVRATLHMKVKDGRGPEFERVWRAIAEEVRTVPGNLRQALRARSRGSDSFIVTSDWSSREAFGEFERSPEQDELTAPLRELRASARMTVHELVIDIEAPREPAAEAGMRAKASVSGFVAPLSKRRDRLMAARVMVFAKINRARRGRVRGGIRAGHRERQGHRRAHRRRAARDGRSRQTTPRSRAATSC